jgi:acetyl esterase/lipase
MHIRPIAGIDWRTISRKDFLYSYINHSLLHSLLHALPPTKMSFKIPKTTLKTTFPFTTHIYSPPGTSLDLYLPVSPSPPHKTLIYFHGGGLATGTRDAFLPDPICTSLLSSSWAVISADYSLLPQATAADILSDLLALEAWILAHPDINTEHIALGGSSAGGYVASLAAGNWTQVKPRALLDLFGVVDVTGEHWAQRKEVAPVVFKSPTADLEEAGFAELLGSKEILSCHELTLDQPPKKGGRASWVLWCIKEGTCPCTD